MAQALRWGSAVLTIFWSSEASWRAPKRCRPLGCMRTVETAVSALTEPARLARKGRRRRRRGSEEGARIRRLGRRELAGAFRNGRCRGWKRCSHCGQSRNKWTTSPLVAAMAAAIQTPVRRDRPLRRTSEAADCRSDPFRPTGRSTAKGSCDRTTGVVRGTESLLTLRWRKADSNHRSRSCERLFWALPIGDGDTKGGATYRFRSETAMLAWSGSPQTFPSRWDREFESVFLRQGV